MRNFREKAESTHLRIAGARISPRLLALALAVAAGSWACTNTRVDMAMMGTNSSFQSVVASQNSFTITRVQIGLSDPLISGSSPAPASPATSSTTVPVVNIYLDPTQTTNSPLTDVCNTSTSTSTSTGAGSSTQVAPPAPSATSSSGPGPCLCQFSWTEINNNNGSTPISIPRQVTTPLTAVQPAAASCSAPSVYNSEIPNNTVLQITIVPASGNLNQFTFSTYNYTTGASSTSGDFQGSQGESFVNILRYSCFEQFSRGTVLLNKIKTVTDSAGDARNVPLGNRFCFNKADGSASSTGTGCSALPGAQFSSQSNYFNLYIPDAYVGDINPGTGSFFCPTVHESLNQSSSNLGTQGKYWPLDSSFALSMGQTPNFTVGVMAHTTTANGGDPVSSNTDCSGNAIANASSSGLVSGCLGFAAKPNADGTCPVFTDANNHPIKTYRLRKFYALYPRVYDADGSVMGGNQEVDTIYVVDRPVATTDPAVEYTMLGPKPCPYAYFDHSSVIASTPGYFATNDSRWTGTDVDGVSFPNVDSGAANSCSATIPVVNATQTMVNLTTLNATNLDPAFRKRYLRPITSWAPHYEEDTMFQACAPLANPLRDPPLHFAKNSSSNVAWCAEAYPTQNDNVAKLDFHTTPSNPSTPYSGNVQPFTSHVVQNSSSPACNWAGSNLASGIPAIPTNPSVPGYYPAGGLALHGGANASTCDRTVINPPNGISWPQFPLLAPAPDVENALRNDPSFACLITHDNGAKAGLFTPAQGCCGTATNVWTGANPPRTATTAHLEPTAAPYDTACISTLY